MVRLHFEDFAGHGGVGVEPLFKVMTVRAIGPEGVDALAVDVGCAADRRVVERRDNDHFFFEHRHTFQRRMQHRAVDERSH